jgi:WD40 repeat protein
MVTLWDAVTGREVRSLMQHNPAARCVAFSPDGKTLATGGGSPDGSPATSAIELWEVATGKLLATLRGHTGGINSLAYSRNGLLASGSGDRTVRLWDPNSGQQLALLLGHTSYVTSVAFSPDGRLVASGSTDTTVKLWDAGSRREVQTLRGHTQQVSHVAFRPDGQRLVSADEQNDVKIWDIGASAEKTLRCGGAEAAAFSPDSKHLAVATPFDLFLYDPATDRVRVLFGGVVKRELLFNGAGAGMSLGFSRDGKSLAVGERVGVRRWDVTTGKEAPPLPRGGPRTIFSPDGRLFFSSDKVLDTSTGQEVLSLRGSAGGFVEGVSFSADSQRLATIDGRTLKVWDLRDGREIRTLRSPDLSRPNRQNAWSVLVTPGVALSPDGRRLAASGDHVKVWDVTTGQELHSLRGHTGWIRTLAFSPDGRRLASGSLDGSVKLWDLATGQEAFGFHAQARQIWSVAFSPDGWRLAAVSNPPNGLDSEVQVWDAQGPPVEVKAAVQQLGRLAFTGMAEGMADYNRRAGGQEGRYHCGLAQWKEAAADFAAASRADPGATLAYQCEQAGALLLAGDSDGYHQACAAALARFTPTPNPWAAQWVARMATLGPDPALDRAKVVRLAEQAVAAHPQVGPWLQTLGAAHYRAGQLDRALTRLQESESADWYGYPTVVNWLLLAQVQHRLGHAEEARRWLDKAAAWLDRATQTTPRKQAELLKLDLPDLMACRLLRREAQLLITGKADDPPNVQNETAWLLATAADPKLRDPARAVALAKKAVAWAPKEGVFWKTLGIAQYRAGDWKAALAALDQAMPPGGGDSAAGFFRAMAQWQLGERQQARQSYDAAISQQADARSKDEDFERFRREAIDLLNQVRLLRSFGGPQGVHWVAFPAEGGRVLSGGTDSATVLLWDMEMGKELRRFDGHAAGVNCGAFSRDGRWALSCGIDKTIRLWDVETGKELRRFEGHAGVVQCLAFSPDGKRALSADGDKSFRLWDVETGKVLHRFEGHTEMVRCVAFSPDGKRALSASHDKSLRLWDVETGKVLRQLLGHAAGVSSVAFSPDGRRALSGSLDKTLRLWNVETGEELRCFKGHTGAVVTVTLSPDARRALSAAADVTTRLWDVETGAELHRFEQHQVYQVWGVAFCPDGRRALLANPGRSLELWELPPPAHTKEAGGKWSRATKPSPLTAASGGR